MSGGEYAVGRSFPRKASDNRTQLIVFVKSLLVAFFSFSFSFVFSASEYPLVWLWFFASVILYVMVLATLEVELIDSLLAYLFISFSSIVKQSNMSLVYVGLYYSRAMDNGLLSNGIKDSSHRCGNSSVLDNRFRTCCIGANDV